MGCSCSHNDNTSALKTTEEDTKGEATAQTSFSSPCNGEAPPPLFPLQPPQQPQPSLSSTTTVNTTNTVTTPITATTTSNGSSRRLLQFNSQTTDDLSTNESFPDLNAQFEIDMPEDFMINENTTLNNTDLRHVVIVDEQNRPISQNEDLDEVPIFNLTNLSSENNNDEILQSSAVTETVKTIIQVHMSMSSSANVWPDDDGAQIAGEDFGIVKSNVKSTYELVREVDEEGNKLVNEYIVICELGRGTFGKVKLAVDKHSERSVAIKILNIANLEKQSMRLMGKDARSSWGPGDHDHHHESLTPLQLTQQEISIMKACRHECLVKLINVIKDPHATKLYMVMEYMEGGVLAKTPNLNEQHSTPTPLSVDRIREMFLDVLFGLQFLHGKGVVHMDIKPENILVGKNGECKLADFGVCAVLNDTFEPTNNNRTSDVIHSTHGTPLFFAPEMLSGESFRGKATDVWALGVTLFIVMFGRLPFGGSNLEEYNNNVRYDNSYGGLGGELFSSAYPRELVDVVQRMLEKNPMERISVRELVRHPFFAKKGTCTAVVVGKLLEERKEIERGQSSTHKHFPHFGNKENI
eukprot:PhF_6_TR5550/c0_g1_i4/m.7920